MKSFFGQFKSSALELKNIRTLTTTGILIAMAMILRVFAIQITPELRITFSFIAIVIVGMLYGPVVCAMSTLTIDILGYLVDSRSMGGYYPPLALVVVIAGMFYGVFLYKKRINVINITLAKASVNLICNIGLNSYFLYTGFVNKGFNISDTSEWNAFFVWLVPRAIKNLALLPIEIVMLCMILPIASNAYKKVHRFNHV